MRTWSRFLWMFLVLALAAPISLGEELDDEPQPTLLTGHETDFARRMFKVTEIVLDKHVEPPTRQEMLLCGFTALYGGSLSDDLRRAVSATATEDDFIDTLLHFWPRRDKSRRPGSRAAFFYGMGEAVILEIDGTTTEGLRITDVIGRLRGAEGTTVTLRVAPDGNGESRLVTLTRSVVPRQTVIGWRQLRSETWDPVVEGDIPVGYLKISEIGGSAVSELREYEAELLARQVDALILDLRRADGRELRHAITLADALLDGGQAGVIRSREGTRSVRLDRDCLFRDWRMAVLVDNHTNGYAEWVAGLLQLHREAIVVGESTSGGWRFVMTPIELPGDWGVIGLATAVLEREKIPTNRDEHPLRTIDENPTQWATVGFASLLSRMTGPNRIAPNGLHSVTPDVSFPSLIDGPHDESSPARRHSDVVRRAVEVSTSLKITRSKSQIDRAQ